MSRPIVIAGPCQHENYEHSYKLAKHCKDVCNLYGIDYYFKASFDKANRTFDYSSRGLGLNSFFSDAYILLWIADIVLLPLSSKATVVPTAAC